jgi:adenylate cyclase
MVEQLKRNYVVPDQVLVKIDDYSLQKIGSWPIPRTEYAKLLDQLSQFGAKVVAMDIMFPEKSPKIGNISPDSVFAESIRKFQQNDRRVFLGFFLASYGDEFLKEAPLEMLNDAVLTQSAAGSEMEPKKIHKYTFPIEELVSSEVGLGSISMKDDSDGIFRHYALISNVDTIYYGSLAFNAFEAFSGKKHTIKIFSDKTGELDLDGKIMEISHEGETKVRFVGAENSFPNVSLYDVLSAKPDDKKMHKLFKDKLVFIGSTANGAHDLRPSPLSAQMPGVYVHMNMAHMLLHKYFFKSANESVMYSLLLLSLGMLILILVGLMRNAFVDAMAMIGIVSVSYYLDSLYFLPEGYELKLFYCFFCFVASYSWSTFWEFWTAAQEKKQIKGTFSRYVAPTVVEEMLKYPDKLQAGGYKMDITCLFSDVRDFTSISEGLSANDLAQSLNFYMSRMTDIVFETKGTLDKYIGDAIVAIWGAPLPIGNHAQHAVEAAIRMVEAMPLVNEEFKKLGRPEFRVGLGLNSGECSVGNMGSDRIFSYTALGDNMNLGARLEGLCKYYGTQILISEYTLERIDKNIQARPIDKVIVKGKTRPVEIFEVLYSFHPMKKDPEALNFYVTAHKLFLMKNFQGALEIFEQLLLSLEDDKPTKRLRDLCRKYIDHPELVTDSFDVTKMTEK